MAVPGSKVPDGLLSRAEAWARGVKRDVHAVYLAARDPRTPWCARAAALLVAAYALSPIDLIPDFIPVVGYLDDLIIVPLGILLVARLIPADILAEHRAAAQARGGGPARQLRGRRRHGRGLDRRRGRPVPVAGGGKRLMPFRRPWGSGQPAFRQDTREAAMSRMSWK